MTATGMIKAFGPTHIDAESLPWFPFTPYSEEVLLKLFHVDLVRGEATLMLKAPGGASLGVHNHYGRVLVYTVQGSWRYAEHDWVAKPGHFVYEVANSQHTFQTEVGEEVLLFIHVEGALEFLDEAGSTVAIETARTLLDRYQAYCADRGIESVDVTQFALS